jgi:hypothetical protein
MSTENLGSESVTPEAGMQAIADNVESILYGTEEEPIETDDEEVLEGGESPPEDDDPDSEDEDGEEEGLDDIASEDDLSLADYLGIDEDRLIVGEDGTVSFNAIIDGESQEVSLKELAKSYQMQGHVNNKSMALETERKEFQETRTQVATELKGRIDGVEALHNMAEEQLVGEYNAIDWNKLRYENPSEWSALRQEYAEKAQQIKQAQGLVAEERVRLNEEQQKEFHQNMDAHMKNEMSSLIVKNPNWSDDAVRKADMKEMKTFLSEAYGYGDKDFDNISDHRLIEVIKDAQSFRNGKKAIASKKVKVLPKFQKPGASRGNAASLKKARAVKAGRAALKKDGGTSSVANAILDRM